MMLMYNADQKYMITLILSIQKIWMDKYITPILKTHLLGKVKSYIDTK